ncbi:MULTISPECIES: hypothetical protein [Paenibacillus]|uniref:hypothetical protein n=1 Tax=Paenibacillus TaxID=44249 RepID=UPI001353426E|nr:MULTISPECIES: hypothetical protein [Paenibacillus]MDY8025807.1 hypothetical protein [Paenibacillus polymyxa]MXO77701.1 hypothetical protein [Paenibacillus sp. OT2-17]
MEDKLKQSLIGLTKSSISVVPYVGNLLNEMCFEIRGRIAQNRVNNFVNSFVSYVRDLGLLISEDTISSEAFNDIYISIIKKVMDTNNEQKLDIFREILKANITQAYESDFRETFLDLVCKLDFVEIEILKIYKDTGRVISGNGAVCGRTSQSFEDVIKLNIRTYNPHLSIFEVDGRYEFYISDLISKSLLIDTKTISNKWKDVGGEAFKVLSITDFGKEFLKFIQE